MQLNFNHLRYFWTVAKEGSIARACEVLHLTPQTISGQLKVFEESIGNALFQRSGRGLVLTDTGRLVKQYADEIFALGGELSQQLRDAGPVNSFTVGLVDSIPKLIAYQLLEPLITSADPVKLVCHEGKIDQLSSDLALHKLDMVLTDTPLPAGHAIKAYNHHLGSTQVGFYAHRRIARKYSAKFPASLEGAPMLLPVQASAMRRDLDDWFLRNSIQPKITGEFADSALIKAFGEAGAGIFPAPAAISEHIEQTYHCRFIGNADGISESYYAVSVERKLKNPSVVRMNEAAHEWLSS